jgi:hypothetical protein
MAHEEDELYGGIQMGHTSSLDAYLQDRTERGIGQTVRRLTDRGRAANALQTPVDAGVRVSFVTNIGSVVAYKDPPASDAPGTIVMVRTAEGDQTGMDGMVFVKFDDGRFMAMDPEHLRLAASNNKVASGFTRRVGSLGDLTGFLRWGGEDDHELVHHATKDLWSFETTDRGDFVISRLFDDSGEPLKV